MNPLNTARITSLLLVTGLFFGCATNQPDIYQLKESGLYEEAIQRVNTQIEASPNTPSLFLQKGELFAEWAQTKPTEERAAYYDSLKSSIETALALPVSGAGQNRADSLISHYWFSEHNAGIEFTDAENEDSDLALAVHHFHNATIIDPSKPVSYRSKAAAEYQLGRVDQALSTLQSAIAIIENPSPLLYENLGLLYLESGKTEQAILNYEKAGKDIITDKSVAFRLVNTYLENKQRPKAVELLEILVQEYPNDPHIRNVYGTELYYQILEIVPELTEAYRNEDEVLIDQLRLELEGTAELAEENLSLAYSADSSRTDFTESLAVFYNNLSAEYLALSQISANEHQNFFRNKAATLGKLAIRYYTQLSSLKPSDTTVRQRLDILKQLFADN